MRDFALLNLLLRTGLRDIEVVRADCGDIQTVSGVDVLYIQGKGRPGKDNYVVLTESALAPIRDYLGMRDDSRDSSPLFYLGCSKEFWREAYDALCISHC